MTSCVTVKILLLLFLQGCLIIMKYFLLIMYEIKMKLDKCLTLTFIFYIHIKNNEILANIQICIKISEMSHF